MTTAVDSGHNYLCSWCSCVIIYNNAISYEHYFTRAFQIEEKARLHTEVWDFALSLYMYS